MGDRCYLRLQIRKMDRWIWNQVFSENRDPKGYTEWLEELELADANTETRSTTEANYAYWDELSDAAKLGAVFEGYHGEGGEYPAERFVGYDGRVDYLRVDHEGAPCVKVNRYGIPDRRGLAEVMAFHKQARIVEALLAGKEVPARHKKKMKKRASQERG